MPLLWPKGTEPSTNQVINGIGGEDIPTERQLRKIDLGSINGRLFALMASCGYDAHAVRFVDIQIDGDFYGELPADIGIQPGALRVFC